MTDDEIKELRHHCNTSSNPTTHVARIIALCDEVLAQRAEVGTPKLCDNCGENLNETPSRAAWLIESGVGGSRPYWWGRTPGLVTTWTDDQNSAVRFSRKEDAERAIALLNESPRPKATEHVWLDEAHEPETKDIK